ncbi:hypothetical protein PACTADRAFT_185016 [Pachysolen tannophilus NRRL Y-2460]|uniref:DUF1774 domain-containing protein n=1 Tax=Pachysolen tannophilus NRRL Y-2460 TaxID=669874 RepID=A0A1E4U359_PACTA|nr:hypothetical protein PACTADRAFT_185016 [Pachysolen tannophilus NRRL Y-2460]
MTRESQFYFRQVSSILSFALAVYGNFRFYLLNSHYGHKYDTPFTSLFVVNVVFWVIQYLLQLVFVLQYFTKNETTSAQDQQKIDNIVGHHFVTNNLLNFFWFWLFKKHHFILSELLLIANFLNLLGLYIIHKTYSIKNVSNWISVHLSTASIPLAWTIYALFWNGAIVFHSNGKHISLVLRILANVFIWDFLLVPLAFLALYNDYGFGFATSLLMLGVTIDQFFTKIISLQWIFAAIICAVVFLASALGASGQVFVKRSGTLANATDREQAPLLSGN